MGYIGAAIPDVVALGTDDQIFNECVDKRIIVSDIEVEWVYWDSIKDFLMLGKTGRVR